MRWMRGFRRWLPAVEKAMGVLLIAFAVLIGTNTINWIANWMLEAAPGLWLLL
jgi:cytochrome c-type biogenesis protein